MSDANDGTPYLQLTLIHFLGSTYEVSEKSASKSAPSLT